MIGIIGLLLAVVAIVLLVWRGCHMAIVSVAASLIVILTNGMDPLQRAGSPRSRRCRAPCRANPDEVPSQPSRPPFVGASLKCLVYVTGGRGKGARSPIDPGAESDAGECAA